VVNCESRNRGIVWECLYKMLVPVCAEIGLQRRQKAAIINVAMKMEMGRVIVDILLTDQWRKLKGCSNLLFCSISRSTTHILDRFILNS